FGHPVFTVPPDTKPEQLAEHRAGQTKAMYQAKVDALDVATTERLCDEGLYIVEANITLGRAPDAGAQPALPVVTASAEHAQGVLAIASTAFHASRFHLDPAVP